VSVIAPRGDDTVLFGVRRDTTAVVTVVAFVFVPPAVVPRDGLGDTERMLLVTGPRPRR
jgi:hypothetical protein